MCCVQPCRKGYIQIHRLIFTAFIALRRQIAPKAPAAVAAGMHLLQQLLLDLL